MPQTDVFSMPYMFGYVHGYCKGVSETRNPPHWYPISLQLRYTAKSEHGTLHRFGQTRMMSSKEIIFAPGDGLAPGMEAEIAVAWPFLRKRPGDTVLIGARRVLAARETFVREMISDVVEEVTPL